MVVIPWYVYAFLSIPCLLVGVVVGVVVADVRRVERLLVVIAGAVGSVSGEWLGVLEFRNFATSMWPPAFIGAFLGSCVLSVTAAWLLRSR
jgi:uncharacterized membrane protein YeaQ/YmgE (transglycosylase-associated protein family)